MLSPDRSGGIINSEELGLLVWEAAVEKRARDDQHMKTVKAEREERQNRRHKHDAERIIREQSEDEADQQNPNLSVQEKVTRKRHRELARESARLLSKRLEEDELETTAEDAVDD